MSSAQVGMFFQKCRFSLQKYKKFAQNENNCNHIPAKKRLDTYDNAHSCSLRISTMTAATAIPVLSPPPPIGTTMVSMSGFCSRISMAMAPCFWGRLRHDNLGITDSQKGCCIAYRASVISGGNGCNTLFFFFSVTVIQIERFLQGCPPFILSFHRYSSAVVPRFLSAAKSRAAFPAAISRRAIPVAS